MKYSLILLVLIIAGCDDAGTSASGGDVWVSVIQPAPVEPEPVEEVIEVVEEDE